jgi:hypothetical protein
MKSRRCSRFSIARNSNPRTEAAFCSAWAAMTDAIMQRSGTGGSRLHQANEGSYAAYAVWPNRKAWEEAGALPSANPEASAIMRACLEQSLEATPLEVVDDRLRPMR